MVAIREWTGVAVVKAPPAEEGTDQHRQPSRGLEGLLQVFQRDGSECVHAEHGKNLAPGIRLGLPHEALRPRTVLSLSAMLRSQTLDHHSRLALPEVRHGPSGNLRSRPSRRNS
eukprot:s782_g10.t1